MTNTDPIAQARAEGRAEGIREAAKAARSCGRPVGAGDGDTYIPGTSADAERAILALLDAPAPTQPAQVSVAEAAKVLLDVESLRHVYEACEGRITVYKFQSVLLALSEGDST